MNTYEFSVIFGSHFNKYYIKSKTLSTALKSLESEVIKTCSNYRCLQDWHACPTYVVISSSGRSVRRLPRLVRGVA